MRGMVLFFSRHIAFVITGICLTPIFSVVILKSGLLYDKKYIRKEIKNDKCKRRNTQIRQEGFV